MKIAADLGQIRVVLHTLLVIIEMPPHLNKQSGSITVTVMTVSLSVPVSGLSPGEIAGIVVAVLLVAAAVGVICVMINRRRSSSNGMYHLQIL